MKYKITLTGEIELEPIEETAPPPVIPPPTYNGLIKDPCFNKGFPSEHWEPNDTRNAETAIIEVRTDRKYSDDQSLYVFHAEKGSGGDNRAEIRCLDDLGWGNGRFNWHQEYWLGIAFRPDDFFNTLHNWEGIQQVHAVPNESNWSVLASCNAWYIKANNGGFDYSQVGYPNIYIDTKPLDGTNDTKLPYNPNPPASHKVGIPLWSIPIQDIDSSWIRFVGHFILSPDEDGLMKWYFKSGPNKMTQQDKVISFTGPNVYANDTEGNPAAKYAILQTGGYKGASYTNPIGSNYSDIRAETGPDKFDLVNPDSYV